MRSLFLPILNSTWLLGLVALLSCQAETAGPVEKEAVKQAFTEPIQLPKRDSTDTTARLYLTFDDGPYTTTPQLMQVLLDKGIRASFFIIGSQIDKSAWHDSVYKAVAAHPNFKIYNHTYSHAVTNGRIGAYYQNTQGVWEDIVRNRSYLPAGVTITRLPGKNTWRTPNRTTLSDKQSGPLLRLLDAQQEPEFIVGWDFEWTKITSQSRSDMEALIARVEKKLSKAPSGKRDVVILSHDYQYKTPESLQLLGEFIDYFLNKGTVKFEWAEQLPGLESGAAKTSPAP